MPSSKRPAAAIINSDVQREHQFDMTSLVIFVADNEPFLTAEPRNVYGQLNVSIAAQQGGFFFLDAPGGTGKTFIISLINHKIILHWQLLHRAILLDDAFST
ncbi:ATP-dependent DNA helicase [Trichonephila clavata]|uniref:ATP-dependent DNA helicase n=1 Tax=Trichonephila clavata TaxID=2740835 RepID=A0A8X6M064_TRICU|nr:ATP-dependent DNA helicase [Trichonephila clavata]